METFTRAFHEEINRLQAEQSGKAAAEQAELAKVTRELERLIDAIAAGIDPHSVKDRIATLETRRSTLERSANHKELTPVRLHPKLPELYARKVADLESALNDPSIRSEAGDLLRSMIEKIELTPRKGAPGLDALIYGDLAHILEICCAGEQIHEHPAALAVGCQLSVVAGACFIQDPTIEINV